MKSRSPFYRIIAACALPLLTCLAACNDRKNQATVPDSRTETPATDVSLQILDYQQIQNLIASHHGQIVVLDCWSTSCPPCIEEFPKLVALHKKYDHTKLACISLSFDFEGPGTPADVQPDVLKFLQRQNATFENVLSSEPSDALLKKMNLASIPAVFVYDAEGDVHRFEGSKAYDDVLPLVSKLIESK